VIGERAAQDYDLHDADEMADEELADEDLADEDLHRSPGRF
jgi:hypothetical protein